MCVSTFCDVIYLEEPHIYKYYQNHSNNIAAPNDTDIDYYPTSKQRNVSTQCCTTVH
jgi:hypothetical protein